MWYRAQKAVASAERFGLYSEPFSGEAKAGQKITVTKPNWAKGKQTLLMWTTNSAVARAKAVCAPFLLDKMGQLSGNTNTSSRRDYPLTAATSDSAAVLADEDANAWYFWFTSNATAKLGTVTFYALVNMGDSL